MIQPGRFKIHKLTDIDETNRQAICSICGPTKIKKRGTKGNTLNCKYRCKAVYKRSENKRLYPYVVHKKDQCGHCGFIPVHMSQLDVDHIDGNKNNNSPDNLQTLCSNCHRLKTHISGDSFSETGATRHLLTLKRA